MLALAALYTELGDGEVPEGDFDGCVLALNCLISSSEEEKIAISPDDGHLLSMAKGYVHDMRMTGKARALLDFEKRIQAYNASRLP